MISMAEPRSGIDIPAGTITTDAYFHDIFVTIYLKK